MAKFPIERFPAGFFDITQDITRQLPADIIDRWTHSDHSMESALRLLAPLAVEGTVVSSDSAGLTRLSQRRGLLEILALINRPKELVHAYGVAIGGESIGVWAADNTQMFFPRDIPAARILSMALGVTAEINRACEVHIGIGAHFARFFRLGGGLYGAEADRIETIAENYTEGGEVVFTAELAAQLGDGCAFTFSRRADLPPELGSVFRLTGGPQLDGLAPADFRYPFPYSEAFYADLRNPAVSHEDMHARYSQRRTVVLIEREREETEETEIAVLNDLALSAAMTRVGASLVREHGGQEIKTAGPIGIYTLPDARSAFAFSRAFREAFQAEGIASRIGIDEGEVVVFDLHTGASDIAGMPVNVASKMAQDWGEFGRIYMSDAVAQQLDAEAASFEHLRFELSGVSIDAWAA
jgi:class 3 adenylate cyclase